MAEKDGPPERLYASWSEQVRAAEAQGYEAVWPGLTRVATLHHFGGTPQPLVLESIRRFAEEVAPAFSGA